MPYEVLEKIKSIPLEYSDEFAEYIDKFICKITTNKPFKRDLSDFYGCLSDDDAKVMLAASEECRKIDYGEW